MSVVAGGNLLPARGSSMRDPKAPHPVGVSGEDQGRLVADGPSNAADAGMQTDDGADESFRVHGEGQPLVNEQTLTIGEAPWSVDVAPSVPEMQPQPRQTVLDLVSAYGRALASAEDLPLFVSVQTRQGPARLGRILHWRPRWLLRTFLVHHMLGVLDDLERCYHRRAALRADGAQDVADRDVVDHFRRSLPALHAGRLLALLLIGVLVVGQVGLVLLEEVAGQEESDPLPDGSDTAALGEDAPDGRGDSPREGSDADDALAGEGVGAGPGWQAILARTVAALNPGSLKLLMEQSLATATFDLGSWGQLLRSLLEADLKTLVVLVSYLALVLYLVLRPLVPPFRLKRMLFNLHPDIDGYLTRTSTSWHVPRSTGTYHLEAAAFSELGQQLPSREKPFDLGVLTLPAFALFGAGIAIAAEGGSRIAKFSVADEMYVLGIVTAAVIAVVLIAPIVARLVWLRDVGRRRRSLRVDADSWGGRVLVGSEKTVLIRRPALLAITATVPYAVIMAEGFYYSVMNYQLMSGTNLLWSEIYYLLWWLMVSGLVVLALSLPWWYRILRELRDLGATTGHPFGRWPAASVLLALLLPVLGWIYLVAITVRRIRSAQRCFDVPSLRRRLRLLPLGVLIPPLLIWELQAQLNTVWRVTARPSPNEAPSSPLEDSLPRSPADRSLWNRIAPLAAVGTFAVLATAAVERAPSLPGDDKELDTLWNTCAAGDVEACAELTWEAPLGSTYSSGALDLLGGGCEGGNGDACLRLSTLADPGTELAELAERELPNEYGDAPELDELWVACTDGNGDDCMKLSWLAPAGSEYALLAERNPPDQYGDADSLDDMWDRCADSDMAECSDLLQSAPSGSTYTRFARAQLREACGNRIGDACVRLWWVAEQETDDAEFAERNMPTGLSRIWYDLRYVW
jgi:hypothetical protein